MTRVVFIKEYLKKVARPSVLIMSNGRGTSANDSAPNRAIITDTIIIRNLVSSR